MNAIELTHIGVRNAPRPEYERIQPGIDAYVLLAIYLESRISAGAQVVSSYRVPGQFAVHEPTTDRVWRVRVVNLPEVEQDTQECLAVKMERRAV